MSSWGHRKVTLMHEKLATSEEAQEDLQRTNATISDELRKRNDTLERLQDRTSRLQKEVKRLRVKAFRAPGQCSFAVEAALAKAANEAKGQSSIWRIKRPNGRIENWVRDLTCKLICVRHVPASQAPGVVSDIVQAFKTHTGNHNKAKNETSDAGVDQGSVETFSNRSSSRFPLEGHVMGQIQLAKEFKAEPG